MARSQDIPRFGTLSGIKVIVSAQSTAGPFTGNLLAENGADVILLEPPKGIDPLRWATGGWGVENERRDMRSLCLDVTQPEGREIFLKLVAEADIFIEASRGGQWDSWGLSDDALWETNPVLIIAHMSGYGQTGIPEYVKRPGYDHTIQAYSGTMYLNGFPDREPILAQKFLSDYYSGLLAYGSVLAAYIKRLKTGEGESIDLAQYEVAVRCLGPLYGQWLMTGVQEPRQGSKGTKAGVGYYECKDGYGIYAILIGVSVLKRLIPFLGLEYGTELFPEGMANVSRDTPAEDVFENALHEFFSSRTSIEAESQLLANGFPCARVMDFAAMEQDPHYQARETFIEWENVKGEKMRGITPVPRFKNNPQQIWRGCPTVGMDTEDILADLGIVDAERIAELYEKKIVQKRDIVRG